MTTPLEMAFDVACAPVEAFAVWTGRFSTWWPDDHTVSGAPESVALHRNHRVRRTLTER